MNRTPEGDVSHTTTRLFVLLPLLFLLSACDKEPDFPSAPASGTLHVTNMTGYEPVNIIQYRASGTTELWSNNMMGYAGVWQNTCTLAMPPGTWDVYVECTTAAKPWLFTGVGIEAGGSNSITLR